MWKHEARVLSRSSRDVLRTSWGRPESTSKGRPLNVRLRRPLDVISGRPRDGQIGSLGKSWGRWRGTSSGRPGDQYLPAGKVDSANQAMRAGKGKEGGFLPLLALPLMMKVLKKESERPEKNIVIWII